MDYLWGYSVNWLNKLLLWLLDVVWSRGWHLTWRNLGLWRWRLLGPHQDFWGHFYVWIKGWCHSMQWRMQVEIGWRNLGLDLRSHNGHLIYLHSGSSLFWCNSSVTILVSLDHKFRDSSALMSQVSRSHHIKYDITNSYQARQAWHLLSEYQNWLNLLTFNLWRQIPTLHNCSQYLTGLWITHHHLGTFR